MKKSRPTRVLVAKCGLDGHERGAMVVAQGLRDAGMEVIYAGIRNTPEEIVNTALQEDVDVIGVSSLSGSHEKAVAKIMKLLKENHSRKRLVIAGGIIPSDDAKKLRKLGVAAVFEPGSSLESIVEFIRKNG